MATYYNNGNSNNNNNNNNNSEIQGEASDGLQTLILMNPTAPYHSHHLSSFSDTNTNTNNNNNLVFLNSVAASFPPRALPHAPNQQQQHLVGIPLDPNHPSHQEIHSNFMPRVHYSMYPTGPSQTAREPTRAAQQGGLSLSLSRVSSMSSPRGDGAVLGSRFLKAAQELLDEVVSVGREAVRSEFNKGVGRAGGGGESTGGKGGEREVSTAERQEIQMRRAKLVGMLDEVEQRYRQYHHQMQIVTSWFEQATGTGSAKTYTALALQTISKQFRCLKDAISAQIRASSKSLGEEDCLGGVGKSEGSSRLKFVDHQIRQQRALQQLGMIQPNAWRPQRGLPERSVSVLRAWLFEHFLHPYPKDSDKIMLAKQTGLTRSQVSNWFINARVRLWKPMVEEMYMEEIKEQEHNRSDEKSTKNENNHEESTSKINSRKEKTPTTENDNINFKSILDMPTTQNSVISPSPSPNGVNIRHPTGFTLIGSPDMENIAHASPKKQRSADFLQSPNSYLSNEQFGDDRQNRENFTLMGSPTNFIGGFGGYPISEIGRFGSEQFSTAYSGNGVALTLGLPHCENLSQTFLQNQNIQTGDFSNINTSNNSHNSVAYESINIQNRKRFAAQLLPDFVT